MNRFSIFALVHFGPASAKSVLRCVARKSVQRCSSSPQILRGKVVGCVLATLASSCELCRPLPLGSVSSEKGFRQNQHSGLADENPREPRGDLHEPPALGRAVMVKDKMTPHPRFREDARDTASRPRGERPPRTRDCDHDEFSNEEY